MPKKKLSPQQHGAITRKQNAEMLAEFLRLAERDEQREKKKKQNRTRSPRKQKAKVPVAMGRESLPSQTMERKRETLNKSASLPIAKKRNPPTKETAKQRERRERAAFGARTRKAGGKKIT